MKLSLHKVRLDWGGYTSSGQYFGIGLPLYYYQSESNEDETEGYVRAHDRKHAKTLILSIVPSATF